MTVPRVVAMASPAPAQDAAAQFYKDRMVTLIIGSSPGGGVDTYSRLLARHLARLIPGNPKVVPQNMPGAGSVAAAAHIYASAPKDGTQVAMVLAGAILDPLLGAGPRKYEPTKFNFIGNANLETGVCKPQSRDFPRGGNSLCSSKDWHSSARRRE